MAVPPRANSKSTSELWVVRSICLALLLVTVLAFWGIWDNDFVRYDDLQYVVENENVNRGLTSQAVVWAFTRSYVSNWHPLTWLSHALDCTLYGMKPAGHHATNLIFHTANAVLLFLLLHLLTASKWRSGLVAALFALHPLHVESVAWVAERKDVLSGFFFLLTLLIYAKYVFQSKIKDSKAKIWYGGVLLVFTCGLMSKSMLVTMPFVLLLLDYWPLKRMTGQNWRTLAIEKIPFFTLTIISSIVTVIAQGDAVSNIEALPVEDRLKNIAVAYIAYLMQTFWPRGLCVFYPFPYDLTVGQTVGAIILLVAITLLFIHRGKVNPAAAIGWFWYLGMLVPVIGIVQVGAQARADRYTYLPLIGIFILVAWELGLLATTRNRLKWPVSIGTLLVLTALAVATQRQTQHWRNSRALFTHASQVTQNNYIAWGGIGIDDVYRKDWGAAMTNLKYALECSRSHKAEGYVNYCIGLALQLQGKGLEALPYLENSTVPVDIQPERNYRLGLSLIEADRLTEAERSLQASLEARPGSMDYQLGMAALQLRLGNTAQAEQSIRAVVEEYPDKAVARHAYAELLLQLNRPADAAAHYTEALKHEMRDETVVRRGYATALTQLGKFTEAREQLEAALKKLPDDIQLNFSLAQILSQLGKSREAVDHYQRVLDLEPKSIATLNDLAWILATDPDDQVRNGVRAVELAERACQLTEWKTAFLIGTLAAAYAEANRFDDAVKTAEKAKERAEADKLDAIAKRNGELLELYRAHKPYREGQ